MNKQKTIDYQNSDEMNKMNTLFNKASCSSSNREKNQLLTQLRTISLDIDSKFEKIIKRNSIREKEFASLQKNYEELKKKLDLTRMHLDQKMELENRGIKSDKEKIITATKETEEKIKSYCPLERPNLLQEALEKEVKEDPHLKPILLWDIEMQRYEELIYILQKRIIAVEENHEFADKILEEFGSVYGLIDEYKSLTIENQKLKQEETQFVNDPVVKRRNSISLFSVRKMILALQKELQTQLLLLSSLDKENSNKYSFKKNPSSNSFENNKSGRKEDPIDKAISIEQDFDSICNDPNFTMFTNDNNDNETDLSTEKAIEEQKNNIIQTEEQLQKLENDLNQMRKVVLKADSSLGSKYQKLFDLNQRLLGQINSIHEKIDSLNEEAILLFDKLKEMRENKNAYQFRISSIFDPYRHLLSDFFDLSAHLSRNIQIDKTLSNISSIFAKDIVKENAKQQPLFEYINPQLNEVEQKFRSIAEKEKEKEREKEREREAKKSARNKNQIIDIQSLISGVQKSSRGQKEHTSTLSHPRGRPSISSLVIKHSITNSNTSSPSKENENSNLPPLNNNNNNNKHSIKFLPLQIPQAEPSKHHHQRRPSQTVLQQQQQQQHQQQLILKLKQYKLQPILTAGLLTRLAEISGFLFNKDNCSHSQFVSTWKAIKSTLTQIIKGSMDQFEIHQHQLISQVQFSGNTILVKELKNIETMTLPIIKLDIETQYEDQKKKPKPKK